MAEVTVEELAKGIAELMEKRLGVGGTGLAAKLRRAGRLLPRDVRRDAQAVADALLMEENPKLRKQIYLPRLETAERRVVAYLKTVNPGERRVTMMLGMLGGAAFSLLAVIGLFVVVMVWQGLV